MKNPNGYGSIVKLKRKNLRKPYHVRISTIDSDGKQHRKSLGYFATKIEALNALNKYHENHYDVNYLNVKFCDLWNEWVETKLGDESLSESTKKGYRYSYTKISDRIKNSIFVDLLFKDFQDMFNKLRTEVGYDSLRKVRGDISQLYDYAINNKIVAANFIPNIDIGSSRKKKELVTFTKDQIKTLWKDYKTNNGNKEAQIAIKIMLMLIYNGCRIEEFLSLKNENVFISDRYFNIIDSKTENGIRTVPIHENFVEIYQDFFNENNTYLLTCERTQTKYSYANFRDSYWDQLVSLKNWSEDLTPHATRKTCSTLLKDYGADSMYHKLILGHSGALNLTERVYTKVDKEKLIETINLIPAPEKL